MKFSDFNIEISILGKKFLRSVGKITDNFQNIERLIKLVHFSRLFHNYFMHNEKERVRTTEKIIKLLNEYSILIDDRDLIMNIFEAFPESVKIAISVDASLENLDVYEYIIQFKKRSKKKKFV